MTAAKRRPNQGPSAGPVVDQVSTDRQPQTGARRRTRIAMSTNEDQLTNDRMAAARRDQRQDQW